MDDLAFVFIETVAKLRPKVVVMENVEGLTKGEAWQYVQRIYAEFKRIGYTVRHVLLKGEQMGIPQMRHRVFFIATRLGFDLAKIDLSFNYAPIPFSVVMSKEGIPLPKDGTIERLANALQYGDRGLDDSCKRLSGKGSFFNYRVVYDNAVCPTMPAKNFLVRWNGKTFLSKQDIVNISTFPQDYQFLKDGYTNVSYVCGMSVPPIMIKRIATRLIESKIFENETRTI
mgnify:CR=1 FL=1